jgi:thiosulfate reductase cytochrome b subunit
MNKKNVLIIEKHSRILRWSHWINFVLLSLMIWSGILIYWADDAYIKIPKWVAVNFNIQFRLAVGMGWHFFIMWAFLINGLVYVTYLWASGEWRGLVPNLKTFKELPTVILHDLGLKKDVVMIKDHKDYKEKFNAAQKIAYTSAILMGAGSIITGLAIYKPVTLGWLTNILGGYKAARFEHFVLMIGFILFFIVHIIQVARAGWNNFRAMVAGYEIEKK